MEPTLPRARLALMLALVCATPSCARESEDSSAREREAALLEELEAGMPWEVVRAQSVHAHRITAISVEASEALRCPSIQIVPAAPLPKDTGMREFDGLERIEVDELRAHHVVAAEIVADEIVAVEVERPGADR